MRVLKPLCMALMALASMACNARADDAAVVLPAGGARQIASVFDGEKEQLTLTAAGVADCVFHDSNNAAGSGSRRGGLE